MGDLPRARMRPAQMVLLFHPEERVPTFHRMGESTFELHETARGPYEERWREWRTPCGVIVSQMHWLRPPYPAREVRLSEYDRHPTFLRFDNASAIGRPCRRCFPEGVEG